MTTDARLKTFFADQAGVASVSDLAGLLQLDEGAVRRWARDHKVRRLGSTFAFDILRARSCMEDLLGLAPEGETEEQPVIAMAGLPPMDQLVAENQRVFYWNVPTQALFEGLSFSTPVIVRELAAGRRLLATPDGPLHDGHPELERLSWSDPIGFFQPRRAHTLVPPHQFVCELAPLHPPLRAILWLRPVLGAP